MTDHPDLRLDCSCNTLSHVARLSLEGDNDPQAYLTVVLSRGVSLRRRLANAWRHVVGRDCAYVEIAEVVLTPTQLGEVATWAIGALEVIASKGGDESGGTQ